MYLILFICIFLIVLFIVVLVGGIISWLLKRDIGKDYFD